MTDSSVQVGNVTIPGRVFLAPLAGFTDLPFRQICRKLGAAYAVAEMVASQKHLSQGNHRKDFRSEAKVILARFSFSDPILRIWPIRPAMRFNAARRSWISTAAVRLKKFVR